MSSICGIYFPLDPELKKLLNLSNFEKSATLPLLSVKCKARIINFASVVVLEQEYRNDFDKALLECVYRFPMYDSASVFSYSTTIGGQEIKGVVKEKETAKQEYDAAISAGKVASLLDQQLPDVFQISIGNIPPKETAIVRIMYMTELKADADLDQIRFVLPTVLFPRYGIDIHGKNFWSAHSGISQTKLQIDIGVEMSGAIKSVSSPSHPITLKFNESLDINDVAGNDAMYSSFALESAPNHRMLASLSSDSVHLDKDFIINVSAEGLDSPTCVIEPYSGEDQSHAIMLTLTPRFALNEVRSELIFVIDRSGSMEGESISLAKSALHLFLKSIPRASFFNIVGFGSSFASLFPCSVEYTKETLAAAMKYADALDADMGGTEILAPLLDVFAKRRSDLPTQVFLLTDGEVWGVESIISAIKEEMDKSSTTNFIRIFTIGIGNGVSRDLVESMSRAGKGYTQYVAAGERMEKKLVQMLKNAILPPLSDYRVEWPELLEKETDDFEIIESEPAKKPVISLFQTSPIPPPQVIDEKFIPPSVQSAPHNIPPIYSGSRFMICSLIAGKLAKPLAKDSVVRIIGESPDGPVEIAVPVTPVKPGTVIHTLAARKLIRDLEENTSYLHDLKTSPLAKKIPGPPPSHIVKDEIVRLGIKYSLSSKYTSFVAVEDVPSVKESGIKENVKISVPGRNVIYNSRRSMAAAQSVIPPAVAFFASPAPMYASYDLSDSPVLPPYASAPKMVKRGSSKKLSLQSLGGRGSGRVRLASSAISKPKIPMAKFDDLAYSTTCYSTTCSEEELEFASEISGENSSSQEHVIRLQQFDGSFQLTPEFSSAVGVSFEEIYRKGVDAGILKVLDNDEEQFKLVWATLVAIATFTLKFADTKDEWELVAEKAKRELQNLLQVNISGAANVQLYLKEWLESAEKFIKSHL